jgi:hypothetical protein
MNRWSSSSGDLTGCPTPWAPSLGPLRRSQSAGFRLPSYTTSVGTNLRQLIGCAAIDCCISHVKVTVVQDGVAEAKAYLWFAHTLLKPPR